MTCNPHSTRGHGYIIVVLDDFTKWPVVIPIFENNGKKISLFLFNHGVSIFGVPKAIFIDHRKHFQNYMMYKLNATFGIKHDKSTPYFPQVNR